MLPNAPARLSLVMNAVTSPLPALRFAHSIDRSVGRLRRRLWLSGLASVAVAAGLAPLARAQSQYVTPYFFTTLAGTARAAGSLNGTGAAARFSRPAALTVDAVGVVYVADSDNNTIRRTTPAGVVTTIAGLAGARGTTNGNGAAARFDYPTGIAVDRSGNLYVVENFNHSVRKVAPDGTVTTFAGMPGVSGTVNATGTAARFNLPWGIAIDPTGNLYVSENGSHLIRKITPEAVVTTFAGVAGSPGSANGPASSAQFNEPDGLALDAAGNLYVADGINQQIRKITPDGIVSRYAGSANGLQGSEDGPANTAQFFFPRGLACDPAGNLYVTDVRNNLIRRITPALAVSTLAGLVTTAGTADGLGNVARFDSPQAIGIDAAGNLYVADTLNNTIRLSVFAPNITTPPGSQNVALGGTATFNVVSTSNVPTTYQWRRDGAAIAGATTATFAIPNVQATDLGSYTVVATNLAGSTTSAPATLALALANPGRLANLSIRSNAGIGAQTLIVGFVVGGVGSSGTKPLLIRGAGPALSAFGVPGVLLDPSLSLFAGPTTVASNDNWNGDAQITAIGTQVGAFAFTPATSRDAALYSPALASAAYTVQLAGVDGTTGVALAEIYDATPSDTFAISTSRLINVSARTQVGTGADILIAGFNIGGATAKTLLLRAVGPTLSVFGVTGVLADPKLDLYSGTTVLQTNDNWGGTAAIVTAATSVGAFPLDAASRDAVLLVTLQPGSYTAQVSGVGNTTGVALVEIYEVP